MSARKFEYGELAPKVEEALRRAFPRDTVELSEGYLGRVHVLVVSNQLNGLSEHGKQDRLWEILQAELGEDAQGVSLVIGYGTSELR